MKLKIKKQYFSWIAIIVLLVGLGALAYIFRQPISKIASENWLATLENTIEKNLNLQEEISTPLNKDVVAEIKNFTNVIYEESAGKGEGITHLARRAMNKHLKESGGRNENLTNEHKVYIEDYLQNKRGEKWLELGEKISFSSEEIEEAIQKSLTLSQSQLENLRQFTSFLE